MVARLILVIAVALLIVQTVDYLNFTVDDTFIPLRVAQNAVYGYLLV